MAIFLDTNTTFNKLMTRICMSFAALETAPGWPSLLSAPEWIRQPSSQPLYLMPIPGSCEHVVEDVIHVSHLHGGPVKEDSPAYCFEGVGAGSGLPHLLWVVQLVKGRLQNSRHNKTLREILDSVSLWWCYLYINAILFGCVNKQSYLCTEKSF